MELGVSRGAVAQWEMRKGTVPAVENMAALAVRAGVCFEWLATGRGPMVFGPPRVAEESPPEYLPRSAQELELLALFRGLPGPKRSALIEMISSTKR
jgi:hypothetical protein